VKSAGAVGIENINIWNFNNLEEMLGNAKALKRNNRELQKNPYWPLNGPSLFWR
jgi:hypothetical protein